MMRLDSALASISPHQGWSELTGEFDPEFVRLVFSGCHFGAEGFDDALQVIDEECNRIEKQVHDDRSQVRLSDLRLLPRVIYLEALRLMILTAEMVGSDFESEKVPPKPKGLVAEDDCQQLLVWAQTTRQAAERYRVRYSAD